MVFCLFVYLFFAEGHAYKKETYGIVSRVKSEISDSGQISGCAKIRQHGKFSFQDMKNMLCL